MLKLVGRPDTSAIRIKKFGVKLSFIMVRSVEQPCPNRHKGFVNLTAFNKEIFHAVLDTDTTTSQSILREVFIFSKKYNRRNISL